MPTATFSVSHARHLALIAFARGRRIGVDLAWLGELVDTESVARLLPGLMAGASRGECLAAWTAEEARRKAVGSGFSAPLPPEALDWHVQALPAPDDFVAALVAEGRAVPSIVTF